MLNPLNSYSSFVTIPYGSDMTQARWLLSRANAPPDYPDPRASSPHPWLPSGMNEAPVSGDEINGAGVNWPRHILVWDDVLYSSPTVVQMAGADTGTLPMETGQTVDVWIQREKTLVMVPCEAQRENMQAEGFRGQS